MSEAIGPAQPETLSLAYKAGDTYKYRFHATSKQAANMSGMSVPIQLDTSANETVKAFGQERNKLGALWFNASHNLEHYGNLVVYMRLKGIVPPSSDPKQ